LDETQPDAEQPSTEQATTEPVVITKPISPCCGEPLEHEQDGVAACAGCNRLYQVVAAEEKSSSKPALDEDAASLFFSA